MEWATRSYSKTRIDRAGETLVGGQFGTPEMDEALAVINNWRACHGFPLNTMQVNLRRHARQVDDRALIAQRIKRLSSIEAKLRRFETMTLSQMQDIGGCRAIVRDVSKVRDLSERYIRSRMSHELRLPVDDYIGEPQPSGYRGIHLICKYRSSQSSEYNGQKIEIQLRSRLQHAWATAVETVGTFTHNALKSNIGEADWLRFFALMGTLGARSERTAIVPGTPVARRELLVELRDLAHRLEVVERLNLFGQAAQRVNSPGYRNAHLFLIRLDPQTKETTVQGFRGRDREEAQARYLEIEKEIAEFGSPSDAVLVSVSSVRSLRRAYPNYFLDTRMFANFVAKGLALPLEGPRQRALPL